MSQALAGRLLAEGGADDESRLDLLFLFVASREPTAVERDACQQLLDGMRVRYEASKEDAAEFLGARETSQPVEFAAWSQVASTVLASDLTILLY